MNGTGTTIGQPLLEFLTAEQADEIHSATLEVLERTGVNVHNARARALLRDAGARVEGDLRVRIPPALVGRALGSAPERVVVADRLGRRAMALERANHEKWMAEGETTLRDRARAKVERLLALPAPPPLDGATARELDRILAER